MRYSILTLLNDGKREAPAFEVEVKDLVDLIPHVVESLANDYDRPFGPGTTCLIERLA